jgi:uncharacterized protein YjbI with pentapeptide repeats
MANKKKRKRPIYKYPLDQYIGEVIVPEDTDIIDYKEFLGSNLSNQYDYRIVFDTCVFNKATVTENVFKRSEFIDCTFIDCDLSNNEFHNCTFMRCEFKNTRFTGSHFIESFISHVLIEKSHCKYLDFADCKLELCEFTDSLFQEANFFDNEIKHISFSSLKLDQSTFYQTSLNGVDLSTSDIYNVKIDLKSIKGAEISSFQAREVCHLLGIKVID